MGFHSKGRGNGNRAKAKEISGGEVREEREFGSNVVMIMRNRGNRGNREYTEWWYW